MDVALLNVKIAFQKNSVEVDAIGNHKNGWTDYYTCHATVSGESGTEKHTAGTTVDDSDLAFTIRWCRKAAPSPARAPPRGRAACGRACGRPRASFCIR